MKNPLPCCPVQKKDRLTNRLSIHELSIWTGVFQGRILSGRQNRVRIQKTDSLTGWGQYPFLLENLLQDVFSVLLTCSTFLAEIGP
jgi:hypothetical protein